MNNKYKIFGRFSDYGNDISEIEGQTESRIDNFINQINSADLDDVIKEIRAKKSLIDTKPAYNNEVVSTCKQLLAFGGAGLALTLAFFDKIKLFPPELMNLVISIGCFYINLTIASLFILLLFLWQSRFRYPFLYFEKIGNTKPYFYYQTISPDTPRSLFQSNRKKLLSMQLYSSDLLSFVEYAIGDGNNGVTKTNSPNDNRKKQILKDELKQYFLLISYQGYTNQFEVSLTNIFIIALLGSLIASLFITFIVL